MTDTPPLLITKNAVSVQVQGQLRLLVAALGGALATAAANHLHLPIITQLWGLQGEQVVGTVVGLIMLLAMHAWQFMRTRLQNQRWWKLATSPAVPDSLVQPHPAELEKGTA